MLEKALKNGASRLPRKGRENTVKERVPRDARIARRRIMGVLADVITERVPRVARIARLVRGILWADILLNGRLSKNSAVRGALI